MFDVAYEPRIWVNRLIQDKAVRNAIRDRWNEVKANVIPYHLMLTSAFCNLLTRQKKNFQTWNILGEFVYLNIQAAGSYDGEVANT